MQILAGELCVFFTKAEGTLEKTIVTADCCYFNPLLRRIIRFLGEHYAWLYTALLLLSVLFTMRVLPVIAETWSCKLEVKLQYTLFQYEC